MKAIENSEFDKSAVLNQCFDCLVSLGLESTTMRSITNATGLKSSSLYYWFKNKDEIISEATNYGLRQIIDELFTQAYEHLNNLDFLFKQFPSVIIEYKSKLRIIYQVLTSPQYGQRLRESCSDLAYVLDNIIETPTKNGFLKALYSSHPDRNERIARLQELGSTYSRW